MVNNKSDENKQNDQSGDGLALAHHQMLTVNNK